MYGKFDIHILKGRIEITCPISTGQIRIGTLNVGIFDKHIRSILDIHGSLSFAGRANIGRGSALSIGPNAKIQIGNDFTIRAKSLIVATGDNIILFGSGCLLFWDILMMNSDFYSIKNVDGKVINPSSNVIVDNNVWIGFKSTILKSTKILDVSIIGSYSLVNSELKSTNAIYACCQ